jgi:hypothetical protein
VLEIRLHSGQWPLGQVGLDETGDLAGLVEGLLALPFDEWPADAGPPTPVAEARAFDDVLEIRLRTGQWPLGQVGLDETGDLAGLVEGLLALRVEEWPDTPPDAARTLAEARAFDDVLEIRLRTGQWPLGQVGLDDVGDLAGLVEGILSLRAAEWPEKEPTTPETAAARAVDDILELRLRTGEWPFVLADFDQEGELTGVIEGLLSLEPDEWPEETTLRRSRPLGEPVAVSPVPSAVRPDPGAGPVVRLQLRVRRPDGRPNHPSRLLAVAAVIVVLVGAVSVVSLTTTSGHPGPAASPVRARMSLVDDQVRLTPLPTAAPGPPIASIGVTAVSCSSAQSCVAVGHNAQGAMTATSTDGGTTWQVVPAPTGVTHLAAVDCPTVGDCWAVGTAGRVAAILRSTDGGVSWSTVAAPAGATSLVSVDCPTATSCRAVGRAGTQPAVVGTDGGAGWQTESTPSAPGDLTSISCPGPAQCAVGSGGGGRSAVASTGDGGATWSTQPLTGVTAGALSTGPGGTPAAPLTTVTGVVCPTTTLCYALGFDAAGSTWVLTSEGPSTAWETSNLPLTTVADGDFDTAFLPCNGAACPPLSGAANTALAIIDGQPGTSLSGTGVVYACRGATSQCWAAGPSGDGFSATVIGSPVPVEAALAT